MDRVETSQPHQEISTSSKNKLEQIGGIVFRTIKEVPPTKRLPNGQSDDFWGRPLILTLPDVEYGDVRGGIPASDAHGCMLSYVRELRNNEGKAIGEWKKSGYYYPRDRQPNQDEAAYFEEEIWLKGDQGTMERITVYYDFVNKLVWGIERYVSRAPNYDCVENEKLEYRYDGNNQPSSITLFKIDQSTGMRTLIKEIFPQEAIDAAREPGEAEVRSAALASSITMSLPVQASVPEQAPPKRPGFLRRLLGKP